VHLKDMQPATVGAKHLDAQAVDGDRLAAFGQASETVQHEPADGVEIGVGELRSEDPIEIGDLGLGLDAVVPPCSRTMLSSESSKSYSSSMSPTICSSTSSMVTSPATPPYSSTTIAMWLRFARKFAQQHVQAL